jgi:hypothetical protein
MGIYGNVCTGSGNCMFLKGEGCNILRGLSCKEQGCITIEKGRPSGVAGGDMVLIIVAGITH